MESVRSDLVQRSSFNWRPQAEIRPVARHIMVRQFVPEGPEIGRRGPLQIGGVKPVGGCERVERLIKARKQSWIDRSGHRGRHCAPRQSRHEPASVLAEASFTAVKNQYSSTPATRKKSITSQKLFLSAGVPRMKTMMRMKIEVTGKPDAFGTTMRLP